jgi:hypothetical protein
MYSSGAKRPREDRVGEGSAQLKAARWSAGGVLQPVPHNVWSTPAAKLALLQARRLVAARVALLTALTGNAAAAGEPLRRVGAAQRAHRPVVRWRALVQPLLRARRGGRAPPQQTAANGASPLGAAARHVRGAPRALRALQRHGVALQRPAAFTQGGQP